MNRYEIKRATILAVLQLFINDDWLESYEPESMSDVALLILLFEFTGDEIHPLEVINMLRGENEG